jgi:hypothetical protein
LFPLFAVGVLDTGGKFAACVVDTGDNFTASVVDTSGEPWLANLEKFKMTLVLFSGAWGKMIHEKNLKQKSRNTVPLMERTPHHNLSL